MNARLRRAILAARAENMPKENIERFHQRRRLAPTPRPMPKFDMRAMHQGGVATYRRGLDRPPQPDGGRGTLLFQQKRRLACRNRCRVLPLRSCWRHRVSCKGASEDAMMEAANRSRSRRRPNERRQLRGHHLDRSLREVSQALESKIGEPRQANLTWKPHNTIGVDDDTGEKILRLVGMLRRK